MAKLTVEELKNVLKTEAEFTDEQLAGLSKKSLEVIAAGYMRQSDYDREMNAGKAELATAQGKLDEANNRLNAEMAEWATLTNAEKANATKQRQDLEKAQADVLRLRQTVERVAADNGLDASKLLEGTPAPVKKDDSLVPDLTGYAKLSEVQAANAQMAEMMLSFTPELMQLSIEHQQLFGTPLDAREIVKELRTRATTKGNQKPTDPRAIWMEQHKVEAKREEVAKTKYDADIKAAEARGREAALSEAHVPGQVNTPGRHSIVFGGERKSALQRPQPGETVARAAAALRTHKYAQAGTK